MKTTLEHAVAERDELRERIFRLDQVIALLTGQEAGPKKKSGRPRKTKRTMSPEARQKMKAAWDRRKARKKAEKVQQEAPANEDIAVQ